MGRCSDSVRRMDEILKAVLEGAGGDDLLALPLPEAYRAAFVRRDEVEMFSGVDSADKDPRKSLHVGEVGLPELAPDEAYVAVMASSINFNTVWTSLFDDQDPASHDDAMLASNQRIWGFESNFGGLAEIAVVKANQLMPKPRHLSWEEAAVNALCNSTAYRMLVSSHGANMRQGDRVLVWGAAGGLGSFAVQYALNLSLIHILTLPTILRV